MAAGVARLAGLLCAGGLTGARAAWYLDHALPEVPEVPEGPEGRDIRVTGRIASLPQSSPLGQRFELAVESAVLDGQPVTVPPRLQLSWHTAGRDGGAAFLAPALRAG
jgi:competence protein ComEC